MQLLRSCRVGLQDLKKLLIHVENTRKLSLLNISPDFFFHFWAFQNMRIFEELTDLHMVCFVANF